MSGSLIPNGKQQYFDANGTPLAGGKVYYYIPYTTTAKNTWQDINLSILNTNPIILDAAGECIAWGAGAYRQQVYDVNNNLIWDQYTYGISPTGSNFVSQEEVQTATQGQTAFSLATLTYTPGINSLVVFVNGSKQLVGTNYTETSSSVVTFASGLNVGDVVDFYASLPATAQNMSNAVTVAYDPPFTNSVATNVQAKLSQYVSVKDFGAKGDGTTNDATAIQNAVNAVGSGTLYFPPGTYQINSTITLNDGMILHGASQVAVILNCPANVTLFDWNPTGSNDRRGFHIWDMTLQSDLCIQINRTANLVDFGVGDSAFVGGSIKRCRFYNITTNAGSAIVASKMFDTVISENQFAGNSTFSKTIILNGCDLNTIENNRFSGFHDYGIIDVSAQSFGSSNRICHNDMTLQSNTSAKFILTSSHYVIIEDNYLEQIGAGTLSVVGIDCIIGGISFGSNVQDQSYAIYIVNNRIEAEPNFGACIRIDPTKARTIICKNPSSTVAVGTSYFNTTSNYLTFGYDNLKVHYYEISGASWGVWDGYKSDGNVKSIGNTFSVNATNPLAFPYTALGTSNAQCSLLGKNIVLTSPLVAGSRVVVTPNTSSNLYFPATTITLTIIARTTSGSGDTLTTSYIDSTNGPTAIVSCSLTQQFQKFTGTFTGYGSGFTNAGIFLNRATTNGDIQIASVSWSY